jgi:hypothetical protein
LRGQATKPSARFNVTCDGTGVVGHAGAALLGELADRLGLTGRWAGVSQAAGAFIRTRPCCAIWR